MTKHSMYYPIQRVGSVLKKLVVAHLVKKFLLIKIQNLLRCSNKHRLSMLVDRTYSQCSVFVRFSFITVCFW